MEGDTVIKRLCIKMYLWAAIWRITLRIERYAYKGMSKALSKEIARENDE